MPRRCTRKSARSRRRAPTSCSRAVPSPPTPRAAWQSKGGTIVRYDSNDEAIAWLRANVKRGDAILLKGSRKYKMEQIAEALGAEVFA